MRFVNSEIVNGQSSFIKLGSFLFASVMKC